MPATDRRHRHSLPAPATSGDLSSNATTSISTSRASSSNWINANAGNIYYRPRNHVDRHHRSAASRTAQLPAPLIGPRRTRPHSIHILTYPSGYVPRELRPKATQSSRRRSPVTGSDSNRAKVPKTRPNRGTADKAQRRLGPVREKSPIRPVLHKLFSTFSNRETSQQQAQIQTPRDRPSSLLISSNTNNSINSIIAESSPTTTGTHPASSPTANQSSVSVPLTRSATTPVLTSGGLLGQQFIPAHRPADDVVGLAVSPAANTAYHHHPAQYDDECPHYQHHHHHPAADPYTRDSRPGEVHSLSTSAIISNTASSSTSSDMVGRIATPPSAYHMPHSARGNSLMSVRSAKSAVNSLVTEVPKPVASGSGVQCSILLAEPNVFLSGFDHDGNSQREGTSGTALLRGRLQLNVTKNIKVKAVQLKLVGRARTEWPEGIPPLKTDLFEEQGLRTQVLTFFNAMNEGWESEYGNQCTYKLRNSSANNSSTHLPAGPPLHRPSPSVTSSPIDRKSVV